LRERLDALAFGSERSSATLALNARHRAAITEAQEALSRAGDAVDDAGVEIVAMELREALDALGRILGEVSPDDVLARVFANFCIGK
jgi:tRNA modification GTPase